MSWASAILTLIGLISSLVKMLQQRQAMSIAEDAAIAKAALEVLESTNVGKELRQKVAALDDVAADELWNRMLQ